MEVRCAALRMKYQKRMLRSNFIGILLIFCFFYIKIKDEKTFFLLLYFYLLPILFCLINPSTLLRMLSKNQDLDFQRSITFLTPKRKVLLVLFKLLFKGTHESSISLGSNSFSFYGIFKLLTLACKSYVCFKC